VNYLHTEHEKLKCSSNLHNNLHLHLTWKLTAISPQRNTFQKPQNQASVFYLNYSCKVTLLPPPPPPKKKKSAAKFLADRPLCQVNCHYLNLTTLSPTPPDILYFVLCKCTRCLAKISHNEVLSLNAYPHSVDIKTGFGPQPASCRTCLTDSSPPTHEVGTVLRLRLTDAAPPLSHTCLQGIHQNNFIFVNLNFMSLRGK
jgi:hypothetical protein